MNEIEVLRKKNEDLIDRSKKKINELIQRIDELERKGKNIELYKAISEAKQEMIVKKRGKGQINKSVRYNYFLLEDILDAADKIFPKFGLLLLQPPSADGLFIETHIIHLETGQRTRPSRLKIVPDQKPNQCHALGGGITYARRYSITSLLGFATEPDTDGN